MEVTRYFAFLKEFGEKRVNFATQGALSTPSERDELFKTLKANGFLLLYNLVESTLKNAIEAIFEEFKRRNVSYDHCSVEVRRLVLKNLKRHDVNKIVESLAAISTDVLVATFRKEESFGGNVDGRFIRQLAKAYGFTSPKAKSDELLTVKTHRNDLAHGAKSFAEVGRDFDVERLEQIRQEVVDFLEAVLRSIAEYLTNRGYLAAQPAA